MALGTTVNARFDTRATLTCPVSASTAWKTIIDAGGVNAADAATVTDPAAEVTRSTTHIIRRENLAGTTLRLRMAYDDGITSVTSPTVKVFGRCGTDPWQLLKNKAGALNAELTVDLTNDASDGTLNYTTPDVNTHSWDCDGNDEILVAVEIALAATGTVSTAFIQGKFI